MFKGLVDKANSLKDKVEVAQAVDVARHAASTTVDAGRNKASEVFAAHWPRVESFVLERALPLANDGLMNDEGIRTLFDNAFAMLPIHLRLILPKTIFIEMAMTRRDPLVRCIQELRAKMQPRAGHS